MRLFVRVEGSTPFGLILNDNLLHEHLVEISTKYYKAELQGNRPGSDIVLIRRINFNNGDALFDFRRARQTGTASRSIGAGQLTTAPESESILKPGKVVKTPQGVDITNVYSSTHQPDVVHQELTVTDTQPNVAACETLHMYLYVTFSRLIMLLTDPTTSPMVEDAFWDTYRQFAAPRDVLERLIERYEVPPIADVRDPQRSPLDLEEYGWVREGIRRRVFEMLEHWVERYYFDFSDTATRQRLHLWVSQKIDVDGAPSKILYLMKTKDFRPLRDRLQDRLLPGVVYKNQLLTPTAMLTKYSHVILAKELTFLTQIVHSRIYPSELLGRQWDGPDASNVPNYITYRDFFARVNNWATYAVVSEGDFSTRVQNLAKLILLCEELNQQRNWDMLVAVHGGISEQIVRNLTSTWDGLPAEVRPILSSLNELLNARGSWRNLKQAIKDSKRPHFPCIASYFREIQFLEEQPAQRDGYVNFYRCIQQHNLLSGLLDGKSATLETYVAQPEIHGQFAFWDVVHDKVLAELSDSKR